MKWNIINRYEVSKSQKKRRRAWLFSRVAVLTVLFLCLSCLVSAEEAAPPSTAEAQWMAAYTAMTEGNSHWSVDEFVEAVDYYRQAVAGFYRLRREYPEWRKDVVAYRLEYCRAKLADCEALTGGKLDELAKDELLRLLRLERERSARLMETLRSFLSEKDKAEKHNDEARRLQAEKAELALEVEKLNRRLEALENISEKYDKARRELADLLMEFEDYREKHGDKEK